MLALSTAYALANAVKPLHLDDPFAFYVARQIASAPFDPYGLEVFWWQWPQPVHEYLLPPFVGYWGALGLVVLGTDPFWWKLSLLPLVALFAGSFLGLARRFAPGLEWPLLVATLFSPALLPSLNFMPDLPALALALGGLWVYLRAEERGSASGAVVAGLLLGLALQTKYTAFGVVGAIVLHGLLWRRWRPAALAVATALALFAAWELAVTLRYGQGMFLGTLLFPQVWASGVGPLALLELLGFCLPGIALLGLAALGVGRAVLAVLALAMVLAQGLMLVRPMPGAVAVGLGALAAGACLGAAVRELRGPRAATFGIWLGSRREALFLALWLAGEALQCLLISPFPQLRRMVGVTVVATLVIGRAAARREDRRLPVLPLVALQLGLGAVLFGVDLLEARAQRDAVRAAHAAVRAVDREGTLWFVGHWGFQHYAEALGMRPLIPDHSRLRAGDWLLVPDRVDQQVVAASPADFGEVRRLVVRDGVPLATLHGFERLATPLVHHPGPRLTVRLFRARRPLVPESGWTLARLADWATTARGRQAAWAAPALARQLRRLTDPRARLVAARALVALGPRAAAVEPELLETARQDDHPAVRAAACEALRSIRPERPVEACARPVQR